jgi:branched-chain amino acid transport system ATP-binding protein
VRLAVQSRSDAGWSLFQVWNTRRDLIEKAEGILERVRLADKRHVAPKALSHGDQRKLEVALLIAMEPKVFMFDEPTAGMSVDEVPTVLELIHDIKQRGDATVLLVEHKMDVVRSLSDRIIVLHNGALVADGEPAEVIASPVVQEAYLGVETARD